MNNYQTCQIAQFVQKVAFDNLSGAIKDQLKKHLLDSLGSMFYARNTPTIGKLTRQIGMLNEGGPCRVPTGDRMAIDRAAQLYTALIRYPDFMDNFLGKESTCHPSDNIGSLLAAAQVTATSGADFLLAMAIGYEIECRLVEEFPLMIRGFDHTALLAYSLAAALSRIFGLTEEQTAHALAMAGCACNPLVTSRASYTYEWKGLASSLVALQTVNLVLAAKAGITGPVSIFEGPRGYKDILDMELAYDWNKEDFELIGRCILKSFNAEVHTQTSLEIALELKSRFEIDFHSIERIDINTFLTAFHIVGGGSYGDRKIVFSKEQADHSLPYTIAATIIDGQLYPEQLLPERIGKPDVQQLLQKVFVHTGTVVHKPLKVAALLDPYTRSYPDEMNSKVIITMLDGQKFETEKKDFHGFFTRPLSWQDVEKKFSRLTADQLTPDKRQRIFHCVGNLENRSLNELISLTV